MSIGIYDVEIPVYDIEVIALESSIFASTVKNIKRLSGFLTESIQEFITELKNNYNLTTASTRKELSSLQARMKRDIDTIPDRMFDMSINVPKGFGVPLLRILNYLGENNQKVFDDNMKAMETLDKKLSDVLVNESTRNTLSAAKPTFNPDDVVERDKALMKNLTKGTGGVVEINILVDTKDRYIKGIGKALEIFSSVKKSDFDKVLGLNKVISEKVEALRHLVEVEKEPITKVALENIIAEIDASAKLNTLMAKHQLMSFEVARAYLKIGKQIDKIENK